MLDERRRWTCFAGAVLLAVALAPSPLRGADRQYAVRGMVLKVDAASRTFLASHDPVPGLMDAMTMPFEVRDARELQGLVPGAIVEFTLVMTGQAGYASNVLIRRYESVERDPLTASRLDVMTRMARVAVRPLGPGDRIPDFTLIDQARQPVSVADLGGRVVAINFVYTRCALPQFCLRVSNNFGVLQKRFANELAAGRLVLLTITFDPERDTPEALARYAAQWKADPKSWHFLTGPATDVRRVCTLFGVRFFPDEGLMNHSLRTAVVDRGGRILANVEGNQYTPEQLGDLVAAALAPAA